MAGNALMELLDQRLALLMECVVNATKFAKEFGVSANADGTVATDSPSADAHYSLAFFACVKQIQQQSLVRWMDWAEGMAMATKEVLVFGAIMAALMTGESTATAVPAAATTALVATDAKSASAVAADDVGTIPLKMVVCLENNTALGVVELLSTIGFVCRGFCGRAERVGVSVSSVSDPNAVRPLEPKLIDKSLAMALQFAYSDVGALLCAWCARGGVVSPCAGCGVAKYCNVDCQKAHWKQHKPACKLAKAAKDKAL